MFVRFRQTPYRLKVSIIETRRIDGKVRHEHIASLGSIEVPPSVADRIVFWQRVNERLVKLSNRIDPATQGKIRGDLHARVPMVTADEQRALQLENAEADERFWSSLHDMNQEQVDGHKALAASVKSKIAAGQTEATKAATNAAAARERVERIKKGDDVQGGLGKPIDYRAILHKAGMTDGDIRECMDMAKLFEFDTDETEFKKFMDESVKASQRASEAVMRKLLRRRRAALQKAAE
jgi:hypothetical protein